MFLFHRPTPAALAPVLDRLAQDTLTYDEIGATAAAVGVDGLGDPAPLPAGYHHARVSEVVGTGGAAWAAAADALRTWQLHRRQGFVVVPDEPAVAEGTTVLSAVPLLPRLPLVPAVHVLVGCRVVWVVDEPRRYGFGYGTLSVHPATGEEAFLVTRDGHGRVHATIAAFSRPRHPLVRLGAPVARYQQARTTRGYLAALRAHVTGA